MASADAGLVGSPQVQPQVPMHKFMCHQPTCGVEVAGRAPIPMVFNMATVSGVVFSHERITRCPNCGTAYLCLLAGIGPNSDLQFAWTPINAQQASPILTPTAAQVEQVSKIKL